VSAKIWEKLNSPLVVWFVGTVVFGITASLVEGRIASRSRSIELRNRFDRMSFEYASRLSQYSSWFVQLLEKPDDLVTPKLLPCVTPTLLRESIAILAQRPSADQVQVNVKGAVGCEKRFKYGSVFDEFSQYSTLALLAQMRIVHNEMLEKGEGRKLTHARGACKKSRGEKNVSDRITNAINALLNTDAVIPLSWSTMDGQTVEDLRGAYMCSFYGIGAEDLWFSDVFAG
jgi:hypothetical protein